MKVQAERCAEWWERRGKGLRYVYARGQCARRTAHPSGYCKDHRFSWRWCEACGVRPQPGHECATKAKP